MSTVLESAIADATKLREMALKHAEKTLVEKYKPNIDSAVQYILEQEEEEDEQEEDPKQDEDKTHVVELNDQLKKQDGQGYAFMEKTSEEVSNEEVDLSFESILSEVKRMEEAGVYNLDEDALEEEYEIDESELSEMLDSEGENKGEKEEDPDDILGKFEDLGEEIELDEADLEQAIKSAVEETVKMEYKARKTGWLNSPDDLRANEVMAQALADEFQKHNEELEVENKKLKTKNKKLDEKADVLNEKLLESAQHNKKLLEAFNKVKEKFEKMQVLNAKLHFTNKTLVDDSLNERQKNKIVESINNADSVEKAKMIYETLQAGVGSSQNRGPESLREAVSNHSSVSLLYSRKPKENQDVGISELAKRMRVLAGIEK
jgi:hypothetical protein